MIVQERCSDIRIQITYTFTYVTCVRSIIYIPYSHQISPRLNFRTEIRGGAKIKGSELGTENSGERKLKGVNWSPKFEKFEKKIEKLC